MPPRSLDRLNRVYGPATWDVYERLDVSLNPNGPDRLHELASPYLHPADIVLDAGCRDAAHLIRIVQEHQVTGVGVDPVTIHIERNGGGDRVVRLTAAAAASARSRRGSTHGGGDAGHEADGHADGMDLAV